MWNLTKQNHPTSSYFPWNSATSALPIFSWAFSGNSCTPNPSHNFPHYYLIKYSSPSLRLPHPHFTFLVPVLDCHCLLASAMPRKMVTITKLTTHISSSGFEFSCYTRVPRRLTTGITVLVGWFSVSVKTFEMICPSWSHSAAYKVSKLERKAQKEKMDTTYPEPIEEDLCKAHCVHNHSNAGKGKDDLIELPSSGSRQQELKKIRLPERRGRRS